MSRSRKLSNKNRRNSSKTLKRNTRKSLKRNTRKSLKKNTRKTLKRNVRKTLKRNMRKSKRSRRVNMRGGGKGEAKKSEIGKNTLSPEGAVSYIYKRGERKGQRAAPPGEMMAVLSIEEGASRTTLYDILENEEKLRKYLNTLDYNQLLQDELVKREFITKGGFESLHQGTDDELKRLLIEDIIICNTKNFTTEYEKSLRPLGTLEKKPRYFGEGCYMYVLTNEGMYTKGPLDYENEESCGQDKFFEDTTIRIVHPLLPSAYAEIYTAGTFIVTKHWMVMKVKVLNNSGHYRPKKFKQWEMSVISKYFRPLRFFTKWHLEFYNYYNPNYPIQKIII